MQVSTKFTIALHILIAVETSGQGELFNFHEKPNPNCRKSVKKN